MEVEQTKKAGDVGPARLRLSTLRKLHADCSTLAGEIALSSNGGRRQPLTGQFGAIRAYAFRQCSRGVRDINEQTIGEWRLEFLASQAVRS